MTASKSLSRRTALGGITTALAGAAVFGGDAARANQAAGADDKNVAAVKALLQQHDKVFTTQDLEGVMKLYSPGPKTVVMGSGPGELFVGKDEIRNAYQHFFQDFDQGKQNFEYGFATGDLIGDAGWVVATGKLTLTKGADSRETGLNVSVTFSKVKGTWYISSFHYSNVLKTTAAQG
jgi:ketosteroid isomerase-like protein